MIVQTLAPFDDDQLIPCYGFGDSNTRDHSVFPFFPGDRPCHRLEGVLERYAEITPTIKLSGPTSFAPIIYKAIDLVQKTGEYHILLIIADGQVTRPAETQEAIIKASKYPLSIIIVGVGDGPWEEMIRYDDQLTDRLFDNLQFVAFHQVLSQPRIENPEQYRAIKRLGLFKMKQQKITIQMAAPPTQVNSYVYYPSLSSGWEPLAPVYEQTHQPPSYEQYQKSLHHIESSMPLPSAPVPDE